MRGKERCDHCGKWVKEGQMLIPDVPLEGQNGLIAVCESCGTNQKYTPDYWTKWYGTRALRFREEINNKRG